MANHFSKSVPLYRIDSFSKKNEKKPYDVDVFDTSRQFNVTYPHRHDDFYEVLYIVEGSGTHTIDFQEYEVMPNHVFFLSPGQIHELKLSPDTKGYIFLFTSAFYHFNKTDPFKLFDLPYFYTIESGSAPLELKEERSKAHLGLLFNLAIQEINQVQADSEDSIRAWLDLILIHCKQHYTLEEVNTKDKAQLLVRRFKQLIEYKCAENINICEYARTLSVSHNHLSEIVKMVTGRTSTDLVNDRMLLEIKRLLKYSSLNISEIAYQLNFSDQSYFSKYFKKLTGISPNDFRTVCK